MSLSGKKVAQIAIKSNIVLFHELWIQKPHHIKHVSPDLIHACDLHQGEFGKVGSVISWKYVHEGKIRFGKQIITEINEEKKLISSKIIEGDLLEIYKSVQMTLHVETIGDVNLVTWTVEYEKLNESVPGPDTLMEMLINIIKDIETAHLSLTGKRVAQVHVKSDKDVFHHLWRHKHHEKDLSSEIISWNYFHDGKNRVAKKIINDLNEEKKLFSLKIVEGEIMELYKSLLITIQVETNGDDNLVTCTVDYEKRDESVPDPDTFLEVVINIVKDIETGHLSLTGKRVAQVHIKSDKDVFHAIWRHKHHEKDLISEIISFKYVQDGKYRVAKKIIKDLNEEKKLISFKIVEGEILELYKSLLFTLQVETNGDDNLVTWTIDYEKRDESAPDPDIFIQVLINLTKDIESDHRKPEE